MGMGTGMLGRIVMMATLMMGMDVLPCAGRRRDGLAVEAPPSRRVLVWKGSLRKRS